MNDDSMDEYSPSDWDCQSCGACCGDPFQREAYVGLTPKESRRYLRLALPVIGDALATRPAEPGSERTVCAMLDGSIGGRCGCRIYQDRPAVCREFLPGSFQCRTARLDAGLPPYPEDA